MKKIISDKLHMVLHEVLDIDDYSVDMTMEDIQNWDSLKHIELITTIEDIFKIEIKFEDAIEMISIKSIYEKIETYIGAIESDN